MFALSGVAFSDVAFKFLCEVPGMAGSCRIGIDSETGYGDAPWDYASADENMKPYRPHSPSLGPRESRMFAAPTQRWRYSSNLQDSAACDALVRKPADVAFACLAREGNRL